MFFWHVAWVFMYASIASFLSLWVSWVLVGLAGRKLIHYLEKAHYDRWYSFTSIMPLPKPPPGTKRPLTFFHYVYGDYDNEDPTVVEHKNLVKRRMKICFYVLVMAVVCGVVGVALGIAFEPPKPC